MKKMPEEIRTFAEARRALERYRPTAVKRADPYTTGHIRRLLAFLGDPQHKMRVVHIAGTSGKTSTTVYAAALLHAAGKRVGHTVSPHLQEVNERVQLGMQPLPEADFCRELSEFLRLVRASGATVTFFELMTAFAFWVFARRRVEYAVVETGLGGRLDATNVVERPDKVAVLTDIGLDHQRVLGPTLEDIAEHKAGIIQLKNAVFCYQQQPEVMQCIRRRAAQQQADLHILQGLGLVSAVLPLFQQRNFGLALAAVRFIAARDSFSLNDQAVRAAMQVQVPGRMQPLTYDDRVVVVDGAHNAQKLRALASSIRASYPGRPVAVLAAFIAADPARLPLAAAELVALADHIIVTNVPPGDALSPESEDPELVVAFCKTEGQWSIELEPDLGAALNLLTARPEPVLVATGSLHMYPALLHRATPQ